MAGRLVSAMTLGLMAFGCSTARDAQATDDTATATTAAAPAPAAGAEPVKLNYGYKEERKYLAQRGLSYDTGRVTIDPIEAPKVVSGVDPIQAQSEYQRGRDLIAVNKVLDALQAHTKAVLLSPEDPQMYVGLGDAMMRKPYTDKAEAAFRTAHDLGLDTAELHFQIAWSLLHQGKRAAAIDELNATLERDPSHIEALERLAINLYYEGDHVGSWDAVNRAEALGHSMPPQFLALLNQVAPEGR